MIKIRYYDRISLQYESIYVGTRLYFVMGTVFMYKKSRDICVGWLM